MFFSFDGLDGVGKTTQLRLFCDWLKASGRDVVECSDPGSTRLGENLREILLGHAFDPIARRAEMLLFMAARAQLVEEVVAPALAAGRTVVSDRYLLANVVYQGHAGGLDIDALWDIGRVATAGVKPALTFVLDMPREHAAARIERELDRMEMQGRVFQDRLRAGYLAEAAKRPQEIIVVRADRGMDEIQAEIRQAAERVLRTA